MESTEMQGRNARCARSVDGLADRGVDVVVTLLATIVFGLGWVLVELERADPPRDRYDAAVSVAWSGAVANSIEARTSALRSGRGAQGESTGRRGDAKERWAELALQRSSR